MSAPPRIVAHYRELYLPRSETFIHETVSRHRRYAPVLVTHGRVNPEEFPVPGPVRLERDPGGRVLTALVRTTSVVLRIRSRRRILRRALDAVRPDVLHAHFAEEAVVAAPVAHAAGIPLVATFYGFDATRLPRQRKWRRLLVELFARVGSVLAEGPHLRDRIISLGCPPDRARVHPIPIRIELFPFDPPRMPADGRIHILQACRFVEKKGVDLTIRAFARIAPEWPSADLWLLGDGPERQRLEVLARRSGFGDRIIFHGMRSHEDYAGVLRRAHLFVHPSRTARTGEGEGGAPTVLLEAQARGLPIIASDHADIPFVTSPAALLAPEGEVEAIAAHLRHLLNHPEEWAARAAEGRRTVAVNHDPVELNRRLESIYDEFIDRSDRSRRAAAGEG
ncbi:MAG TPA: glycosyltransferase [Longimicrobiales bacterium]